MRRRKIMYGPYVFLPALLLTVFIVVGMIVYSYRGLLSAYFAQINNSDSSSQTSDSVNTSSNKSYLSY